MINVAKTIKSFGGALSLLLLVSSCDEPRDANPQKTVQFPSSLTPIGDGYPRTGDPCRLLKPTNAIERWRVQSSELVGCPSQEDAQALDGEAVGIVDGFLIVAPIQSPEDASRAAAERE